MDADESASGSEVQQQLDALRAQVKVNRGDIDALLDRADASSRRVDAGEARAAEDRLRIDDLEAAIDVDREMIRELHDAGLLSKEHVGHLEQALQTSRVIGAAIGMIMATRGVTQEEAFAVLSQASQHSNRKLRDLAQELVTSGDASALPLT